MKGYITPEGRYYEAPTALSSADTEVTLRPSTAHLFDRIRLTWATPMHTVDRKGTGRDSAACAPTLNEKENEMQPENIRLTLKDVIQITFAVVSIVSVYYALRQDIQNGQHERELLKARIAALERSAEDHERNESAHWRQFQEVGKQIRELDHRQAYDSRHSRNPNN